jgi:hypothetical protein
MPTPRDKLSPEFVTSPPRKKFRTTFGSSVNDSERMTSKPVHMKLKVGENKSLRQ